MADGGLRTWGLGRLQRAENSFKCFRALSHISHCEELIKK